jgi:rhamnose utilization protein RhaD (predicted bifunctional aldolase and dehydrogenase)/NAD(P)-dependent dehydrogenase (short-subunit alcohol dehydrogenase family)
MKSRWNDGDFASVVQAYVDKGVNRDLAIRTYTTRLLGQDPELVLHGGGNTSVKTVFSDRDGTDVDVLCVKGSGWDMGVIEPQGLPAVRLKPLQDLVRFDSLTDEDMVMLQRRLLMDPAAPNPSVEAILHAILPFKHIDHTHANAIVSLTNQPHGEDLVRELFPDSIIVPYVMPGFVLAKVCDEAFRAQPRGDGMILLKHGIFTWSEDPREAYEDMIAKIDAAERRLARGIAKPFKSIPAPKSVAKATEIAPILRGAIAIDTGREGAPKRFVLEHRTSEAILDFCNAENAGDLVRRGNATPEHVLHIKRFGVSLPAPDPENLDGWTQTVQAAVAAYKSDYIAYFERNNARAGGGRTMLDPMPRVFYVQGVGLFAAGPTAKNARIAADVAEATIDVITKAEGLEAFEALSEEDLFDIEYWSLEQAKLAKAVEKPLTRQVALVTGGAGGLGLAIAKALKADGAEIILVDIAEDAVKAEAKRLGGVGVACDVTDPASVTAAIAKAVSAYGGVDILISNAGAAFQGKLIEVPDEVFRKSMELNFWGHQLISREVAKVMRKQKTGGAIVFNISKQAVNPGAEFAPYGTAKAAALALMRHSAIEFGPMGVTCNAVNADRIRTGLMTDAMVEERSRARGVTPHEYMRGNLLGREVTAEDVAEAFLSLAKARAITGAVVTVDGGNVAAMMR